jgi:predicted transcriptional regulator
MTTTKQAISVRLPPDLHHQVSEYAAKTDRSMGAVMRVALREWLEQQQGKG